ncbi:hypothetical protein KAW38_00410 [Candidatus Micrarchaeota archaeon]|nr:hypothetical protein [Candidatus Micrarchaeota archaeon]
MKKIEKEAKQKHNYYQGFYEEAGVILSREYGHLLRDEDGKEKFTEIEEILKDPGLFNLITEKEFNKKIVGELETRKTIFLCACGKWVENNTKTSYNLMINSESGAGKDWVTSSVLEILPEGDYEKRTRITPNVFTYWHNSEYEPEWTWDGKVFYCEDISNEVLNSDVFKVMASGGSHATVLVRQKAVDIKIQGNPVIFITSSSASPSRENLRRFTILNLDESTEQTKAIKERAAKLAQEGKTEQYGEDIRKALGLLERVKVKVPYADKLTEMFPDEQIIIRTHFSRFLDYIRASTALHQKQRKRDDNGYYLAEEQDYNIARLALLKVTSNPQMIPLTKDQRKILSIFEELGKGKLEQERYSVSDLEPHITFMSDRWMRVNLDKLTNHGFLKKDVEKRENSTKPVMVYCYEGFGRVNIPTWGVISKYRSNSSIASNALNSQEISDVKEPEGANEHPSSITSNAQAATELNEANEHCSSNAFTTQSTSETQGAIEANEANERKIDKGGVQDDR